MGLIVESCSGNQNCCNKKKIDPNYKKNQTFSSEFSEEEDYYMDSRKFHNSQDIPQNIVDIKVKQNALVIAYSISPWSVYKVVEEIGSGAFGTVKKVMLINNKETIRAMKILPRENIIKGKDGKKLIEEIEILKNMEHPNIVKIFEYFYDKNNVYIISEFCDQGDLLEKIEKLGSMNQLVVKFLMGQIFNAVSYLHANRVFHGDIKLENVMLYKTSHRTSKRFSRINRELNKCTILQQEIENSCLNKSLTEKALLYVEDMIEYEVKLIDFGCSKFLMKKKNNKLQGIVGTSIYCSPEVIDDLYDERSDEWACGVLMYILLCGKPPFEGETEDEIFNNVKNLNYNFLPEQFNYVSENCKDLIRRLLEPDKNKRITAYQALKHPFFTENFNPNQALTIKKDINVLKQLLQIKKLPSKFHEIMVAYLCYNFIDKDEEKKLREVFRYLDHRKKNRLNKNDFEKCFKENKIEVTSKQMETILNALDSDGSNSIEYQEFLRAMCDKKKLFCEKNLKSAFNAIDIDGKGFISVEKINQFIFKIKDIHKRTPEDCLKLFGMEETAQIKFDKFCGMIRNNTSLCPEVHIKENNIINGESLNINEINDKIFK